MLDLLQFIFSSFWVFLGTFMLLWVVTQGLAAVAIALFAGRR
jgi:hypothetical protein